MDVLYGDHEGGQRVVTRFGLVPLDSGGWFTAGAALEYRPGRPAVARTRASLVGHHRGVPFLDAPIPIAFSHRGFAPDGGENSMAAFERAIALGYRYLETDVRVTRDGVVLAFHDTTLDRVTDQRGKVRELPWAQVRHARIDGRERIPLLAELLDAWPHARVNIDIKAEHCIGPTIDAIRRTGSIDRVCVGAFSGSRVAAMRRVLGPRLCTSLGPREALALRAPATLQRVRRRGLGNCAQVPARIGRIPFVDARYLATAHGLGLPVHVWTVNRRAEMARLLDLGVDGLMTDAADVLRDLLLERGQWPAPATET